MARKKTPSTTSRSAVEAPIPREAIPILEEELGRSLEGWESAAPLHVSPMPAVDGAYFDVGAVVHVVKALRALRHTKGKWAGHPLEPEPWQIVFIIAPIFGWRRPDDRRIVQTVWIEIPRKNGKALDIQTPIATPHGWKRHGDLKPGDLVFGANGVPVMVLAVTETYEGPCYEVRLSDGESIVAHAEHEWVTERTWYTGRRRGPNNGNLPPVTTGQLRQSLRGGSRGDLIHSIPVASPLELSEQDLPVDPYVLGVWLGDGHTAAARITCCDAEILSEIERRGYSVEKQSVDTLYLVGRGHLQAALRQLGVLGNKRIPAQYLRASRRQRIDLLRGLMDTDGFASKAGQCELVLTKQDLFADAVELVRTLGYKPTIKVDRANLSGKDCGERYRAQFWSYSDEPAFALPRKVERLKARPERRTRAGTRQVVSVEPVGTQQVNCIQVEGGLYLAGRGMVTTHNSTLASGLALVLLCADGEAGAEVYAAAGSTNQARIVFDEAKKMAAASPLLKGKLRTLRSIIEVPRTGSYFRVLSRMADAAHGLNVHGAVVDEVHVHKSRDLIDAIETGTGAREQPLIVFITTADEGRTQTIYAEKHDRAVSLSNRTIEDPTTYAVIWAAGEKDDPYSEATWRKANPNYGISVRADWIHKEAEKARTTPTYYATFLRLVLNRREQVVKRWLPLSAWDKSAGLLRADELAGRECYAGLDLANTTDLASLVLVFPFEDGEYRVLPFFWVPEEAIRERSQRDHVPYDAWVREGFIQATEGNVIDYAAIRKALTGVIETADGGSSRVPALIDRYEITELGFDPWNATQLVTQFQGDGLTCVPIRQGYGSMSAPTKETMRLVLGGRLIHGGNPVLRWMAEHMILRTDPAGNVKPDKEKSTEKIDGLVATIMGVDRASRQDSSRSIIEDGEVLIL